MIINVAFRAELNYLICAPVIIVFMLRVGIDFFAIVCSSVIRVICSPLDL